MAKNEEEIEKALSTRAANGGYDEGQKSMQSGKLCGKTKKFRRKNR
ncbi:MAG: hypothetical protein ACLTGJ_06795 [Faecalibacterium prausnitzii]